MSQLTQIHLLSPKTAKQFALQKAMRDGAAEKQTPPPALPPLDFDGMSGRGVRLRHLTTEEKDTLLPHAANAVGANGTMQELNLRINTEGAKRMIVSVTRKAGLISLEGLAESEWEPMSDAKLDGLGGDAWVFSKIFTPKDVQTLRVLYSRWHTVSEDDVDEIEGKAISMVSE